MFANTIKLLWLARFAKDRIISGPIPAGSPEVTTKGIILSLSIKNVNELIVVRNILYECFIPKFSGPQFDFVREF